MPLSYIHFVYLLSLFSISVSEMASDFSAPHRSRRQLLFPNTTLLQFNAGVGTPTGANMINLNWAFQANFQLPWNRTQIPIDILQANAGYDGLSRKKRDVDSNVATPERDGTYENDAKLYHFYKYVEDILDNFGHNGTECVLQALCQLGAEPLHSEDADDLLHEIASYVLNPTNDISHGLSEKEPNSYIEAYQRGQNGEECLIKYACSTSLIDMISILHDVS